MIDLCDDARDPETFTAFTGEEGKWLTYAVEHTPNNVRTNGKTCTKDVIVLGKNIAYHGSSSVQGRFRRS